MIIFKLNDILIEMRVSRNRFSRFAGIRPNTINDMCNGSTRRIELDTLDRILEKLNELSGNKYDVSDLIVYLKEEK